MKEQGAPTSAQQADMVRSRAWAGRVLSGFASLPLSFRLDGKAVAGIPEEWKPVSKRRTIDARIVETVFEGRDPATGLQLRVGSTEYLDYPVVEWVAWLTNTGSQPTPILGDILAIDGAFEGASPVLWHCNGDFNRPEGYTAEETPLPEGGVLRFAPKGGRPCDGAFPYYRVAFAGGGVSLAIGWPGQWSAEFRGLAGGVHVRAGQEQTNLRLLPGETVRTPRITVMFWEGGPSRGANLWRRWYRDHLLPRPNGRPLRPLLAAHGTDEGEEFTAATEENQVRYIERWTERSIPFDVWWIDAGWYPCFDPEQKRRRWSLTGTWVPDPERFPRGLKPVSNAAARRGADLLLWFEPERVTPSSQLDRDRPEWLLKAQGSNRHLLNLGNPACRQWLTDHTCQLIRDNGVRIYRQDHNFAPLQHWRENEAPDRQGINENLHVQGYLQFWDDLLARNPGLWIDSCASGGRRNDLETLRRSVPLHYTDYGYGNHPVKLSFQHVLFEWIPYFKEGTLAWDLAGPKRYDDAVDRYAYHCGFGPMLTCGLDIRREDYDWEALRQMLTIWRRAAELMLNGDYYPLTPPCQRTPDNWVVRQFDWPEANQGFIQAIRLPAAGDESLVTRPKALRADGVYLLENPETGESQELIGRHLIEKGLTFVLAKRQAAIWFYRTR